VPRAGVARAGHDRRAAASAGGTGAPARAAHDLVSRKVVSTDV
jgi:hypothetical protein